MTARHTIVFVLLILFGLALGKLHHEPEALIDNTTAPKTTIVVVDEPDRADLYNSDWPRCALERGPALPIQKPYHPNPHKGIA
jgi:hypothetical protein